MQVSTLPVLHKKNDSSLLQRNRCRDTIVMRLQHSHKKHERGTCTCSGRGLLPRTGTALYHAHLFQAFPRLVPVRITLNISSSATGLTLGIGTSHFPAFSLRFCLTVLLRTLARLTPSRSSR